MAKRVAHDAPLTAPPSWGVQDADLAIQPTLHASPGEPHVGATPRVCSRGWSRGMAVCEPVGDVRWRRAGAGDGPPG